MATPADLLQLEKQICFPLYAATRAMMQAYQPLLSSLELTYPQYLVLLVLWEKDGLAVKDIGARLYLDSGTLTPLLKRLEDAGIVRRQRSTEDERVVQIFLTTEGKRLKRRAQEVPSALACKLALGTEELVRIRGELTRLFEHIRDLNEAQSKQNESPRPRKVLAIEGKEGMR
jgi:DNA-binding MarR family transcriptional regulator